MGSLILRHHLSIRNYFNQTKKGPWQSNIYTVIVSILVWIWNSENPKNIYLVLNKHCRKTNEQLIHHGVCARCLPQLFPCWNASQSWPWSSHLYHCTVNWTQLLEFKLNHLWLSQRRGGSFEYMSFQNYPTLREKWKSIWLDVSLEKSTTRESRVHAATTFVHVSGYLHNQNTANQCDSKQIQVDI